MVPSSPSKLSQLDWSFQMGPCCHGWGINWAFQGRDLMREETERKKNEKGESLDHKLQTFHTGSGNWKSFFGFQSIQNVFRFVALKARWPRHMRNSFQTHHRKNVFFWCSEDLSSVRSDPPTPSRPRRKALPDCCTACGSSHTNPPGNHRIMTPALCRKC